MQSDEKESPRQKPSRTKREGLTQPETRVTEEDYFGDEDDDLADSTNPYRSRNSSIRLRDPRSMQPTGPQTTRRNVNLPDPVTGRVVTPGPLAPRTTRGTPTREVPIRQPHKGPHWLLYVGVGMIAMLALWVVGSTALAWGVARYNDIRYGNPRTFQTDAVVGHGDDPAHPSHFIAINLHRHIVVVEFMAGNPARAISYSGPYLFDPGGDLTPVTLEFRDVTGDGLPDMLIHIGDQTIVFVNDGKQFRPQNSNDHIHL